MQRIYLDNACTTFPKPRAVADAVYRYMTEQGTNLSRGGYETAYEAEEWVYQTREEILQLFDAPPDAAVIFTRGLTESSNVVLKGILRPGDHVLCSSMEHNAVMRPLVQLGERGVTFSRIPSFEDGSFIPDRLDGIVRENTRALVMLHASNVCGTVLDLALAGAWCRKRGILCIADTAQSAGVLPISMRRMGIDILLFAGHKGLFGPQGIGGFVVRKETAERMEPLIAGGTGSVSHLETMPDFLPDRLEAGTLNIPGIAGLKAGIRFVREVTPERILEHERYLTDCFLDSVGRLCREGKLRIIGKQTSENRVGVVSVTTPGMDLSETADRLDREFGIQVRVGLHCAPNAHRTLGTFPGGTIRFSFGFFNTEEEIRTTAEALEAILHGTETA